MNCARWMATNVIYMRQMKIWETLPGAKLKVMKTRELQEFIGHDG